MAEPDAPLQPPAPPPSPPGGQSPSSWPEPSGTEAASNIAMGISYAIALIPLGLATLLWLMASAFYQPLSDERITVLAVSPAFAFLVALAVLAAIGALVVRYVRQAALVGLVLFATTSAGLFLVLFAPAIILIAINLGTGTD